MSLVSYLIILGLTLTYTTAENESVVTSGQNEFGHGQNKSAVTSGPKYNPVADGQDPSNSTFTATTISNNGTTTALYATASSTTEQLSTLNSTSMTSDGSSTEYRSVDNASVPTRGPAMPSTPSKTTPPKTTPRAITPNPTTTGLTAEPSTDDGYVTLIVFLIILAIAALVAVLFFTRKKSRRYSVDLRSRQEDAEVPLSTVDPEGGVDATSTNGMRSFSNMDTTQPKDSQLTMEAQGGEGEKADADTGATNPDPPAPASSPAQSSPDPPAQSSPEGAQPGDGAPAAQTSVDTLIEQTNENSNNNTGTGNSAMLGWTHSFSEIPLDCPV